MAWVCALLLNACGGGDTNAPGSTEGRVDIAATFNECPLISSFLATPLRVYPGGTIHLSVSAEDPDGGALTYSYSTPGRGEFSDPSGANTEYANCDASTSIRVVVSDGRCSDTATVQVNCAAPGRD